MEGRMTVCNMSIEAGARAGLVAVDETTIDYLRGTSGRTLGRGVRGRGQALADVRLRRRRLLRREVVLDATQFVPYVTWGTNPAQVVALDGVVPSPEDADSADERESATARPRRTWTSRPAQPLRSIPVDVVFIGSCTNSRVEDLRAAASVVRGHQVSEGVRALVVPGSRRVKDEAELEGLDQVFLAAGFEWREPGCSMCLGMNPDVLRPGQRCASTSNRNFEGRQGRGGRTHLVSPAVAAATAVLGRLGSPDEVLA